MKKTAAIIAMLLGAGAALANTTLTIDLSNKTVAASATIAIRETVNITLVNIGTSSPGDLVLRIVRETNAYANAESFTASGTNAVGALDLNTTELVDAYKGLNPTASKQWSIAVWDTSQGSLLVNDFINIQNNPYDESMPGPSPVGVSYVLTTNAAYLNSITGITYRTQGNTGTVEKLDGRNARITFPSPEAATGAVVSVNGKDGVVILDTSDVDEGTNLYYTEARVSANASVTDALARATAAYPASNPSNYVDASITNSLYPSSNPSNFVDANVTNDLSTRVDGMTNGAALGATAVQPTDSDYTNAVAGAALGASALQPGADGTSTNLSEYSNDAGFLTSNLVLSVHGRIGAVVAAAGDYALYYSPTGHVHAISGVTGLQAALDAKASTSTVAAVEVKADQGVTAYLWGPHAEAGYLTSTNTRYNAIDVADMDLISTNISGLTDGTYTGVVTSVAFTGAMDTVVGRFYVWGFTKQNNFGTGTLSAAGAELVVTAAGTASNYFKALSTDSNLVLRIDGDGSSKSDVSNVFVYEVTNGLMSAVSVRAKTADFEELNLAAGGDLDLTGTDVRIADSTETNNPTTKSEVDALLSGKASTVDLGIVSGMVVIANGNIATNAQAIGSISTRVDNAEGAIITNSGNIATNAQAIGALSNEVDNINSNIAAIPTPTNQIIVVDGTAYIITNAPASAGDVLVFDPASTTAYFSAQSGGGGLTLDEVKDASPLMTNSEEIVIGKQASAGNDTVAIGYLSRSGNSSVSVGYDSGSPSYIFSVNLGCQAKGRSRSVLSGYRTSGEEYSTVIGYYAKGTNDSAALGALVTNPVPGTTRVRGDLYLDGGTKIYTRSAFNSGEFSELATGGATAGTYPVFAIPLGGAWTDFEIKASTNNFTDLCYYYKSWTNTQDATRGDTNALCYFTDDHAGDVRVWNLKTQTNAISEMLISTNSEVETVYFYPSHDCTIPWGGWMSATNTALVWSFVRVDDVSFEMNASGTYQHWSPIRPDSWDAARTVP